MRCSPQPTPEVPVSGNNSLNPEKSKEEKWAEGQCGDKEPPLAVAHRGSHTAVGRSPRTWVVMFRAQKIPRDR